jgi:hypothetical protein
MLFDTPSITIDQGWLKPPISKAQGERSFETKKRPIKKGGDASLELQKKAQGMTALKVGRQ